MNRRNLGLKKPEGVIHGTLTEQDIFYSALENTSTFRKNDEWGHVFNDKEWRQDIDEMYYDNGKSIIENDEADAIEYGYELTEYARFV